MPSGTRPSPGVVPACQREFALPMFETIAWHPSRVRSSSLGVYLLCALSSLRESLSCSLRLPPLPLHGYPCGLLPLIPLLQFPAHYSCTQRTGKPYERALTSCVLRMAKENSRLLALNAAGVVDQLYPPIPTLFNIPEVVRR